MLRTGGTMLKREPRHMGRGIQTSGIHTVLSLIAWSVVDVAVLDRSYNDKEVTQAYKYTWEEVAQTLLEETEWNTHTLTHWIR